MCEQRNMQETCWTGRKHFWSLEAHRRLKLFNAKVQHVIGRVAVHWEASGPKLVSPHDEGLFLPLKTPSHFREILHFIPGLYGKPVFFFLRDIHEIHDVSDFPYEGETNLCLSDSKEKQPYAFTSNTPEFPRLMFCPGTTASFTVPWQPIGIHRINFSI